jgi:putative ABC transport system permease protein
MRSLFGVPVDALSVALLIALAVVLGALIALGLRHPVYFKMGLRNGLRRRGRTIVIVLGLTLGTAIIASALATGDTMSRTIRSTVVRTLGNTDEIVSVRTAESTVAAEFGQSSDLGYFPESAFDRVRAAVVGSDLVDGITPAISEYVAAQNPAGRRNQPSLALFGADPAHARGFGTITRASDGASVRLHDLRGGEVFLDAEASRRLRARPGDSLTVYAGGPPREVHVRDVVEFDGAGSDRGAMLLALGDAQRLLGRNDTINQIRVSNAGDAITGADATSEVRHLLAPVVRPLGLEARPVKADGLDAADAQGDAFMTLFSTFGMFTISAGILLIFLIFVMLAAERRSEMGTARAVGMQRRHLVEVFVDEGVAYDVAAAAIGTALGIAIAYGMVEAVASAFDPTGRGFEIVHDLSFSTVAISYALGVLLTFAVVAFSAWRVSVLNIVTAIRDLPDPPARRSYRRRRLVVTALTGVLGVVLVMAGVGSAQGTPFLLGVSLVIISGVGFAAALGLEARVAYTVGGVLLVLWWLLPFSVYRALVPELSMDFSVWVVGGLLVVLGTIWTLVYNAEPLSRAVTRAFGRFRALAPVLRTSVAYPLRSRFRTGMTIALFTLVVFTLVVGATTSDAFNRALDDEGTFGGGFQVRAEVAPSSAFADPATAIGKVPGIESGDVKAVATQSFVPVEARQPGPGAPAFADYPIRGLDDAFLDVTTFGFAARAKGYRSDRAVWEAMRSKPGLAVVDSLVVPRRDQFNGAVRPEFALRGFRLEDGSFGPVPLDVRDPKTGATSRYTVIGVLKDTAPLAMAGISTSQRSLAAFGDRALPTVLYLRLAPGVDAAKTADRLESAFLASGMHAESIGAVLRDVVSGSRTVQRIVLGFLALGLVIGVAALGVVSARSVVERRQQIGVLRALGFQRGMVQTSFLLESTMIAATAIVLGTLLGLVLSYNIIADSKSQPSWSNITYQLPWGMLAIVFGLVYLAALAATFVPARQASRIVPASALRYQ